MGATLPLVLLVALSAGKPKLVVLELTAGGGVPRDVAAALSETAAVEAGRRGYFDVISHKDIQTMLGLERQRELMGCRSESGSCLAELGGALGASMVLTGSITRLGDAYQLNLQMIDSAKAQAVGRSTRLAKDLTFLRRQIPYALAEASGIPPPPPPSKVLPYSVIGAGAVGVLAGVALGMDAISSERALGQELLLGESSPAVLRPYSKYVQSEGAVVTEKIAALAVLVVGAAAVGFGIYLMPDDASGGASLALLPTGNGLAFVGAFR